MLDRLRRIARRGGILPLAAFLFVLALPAAASAAAVPPCAGRAAFLAAPSPHADACPAAPRLVILGSRGGAGWGPWHLALAGQGFQPGEAVRLGGQYAPLQGGPGPTGCRLLPFAARQVRADRQGAIAVSLTAPDPGVSVNVAIRATGASSGAQALAIADLTPDC